MSHLPVRIGTPSASRRSNDHWVALAAAFLLATGALYLGHAFGWRQAALYSVGGGLGLTLYHASFGFTGAWRRFLVDRRGDGVRAQLLLLAIAVVLFFPALNHGSLFGRDVVGSIAPLQISVLVGAFAFGIGMQLGGGCASGTLFSIGGGSMRMLTTLAGFILGALIATAHLHWWRALPALPAFSMVETLGLGPALAANLAVLALLGACAWWLEQRRHRGKVAESPPQPEPPWPHRLVRGPWPLAWGAIGLALLNFTTLALAGRPWGVASAFALWGAKLARLLGIDVAAWPHWAERDRLLAESVLTDVTSVMNFGIVVGALLAAGLAGKFAPVWRSPPGAVLSAIVGGLLLGYGAILAFGCNIGALFSGVASGSLHGWLWLAAAFAGNVVGTRLRPVFDRPSASR